MITLLIRYTIDPRKLKDFETYAQIWPSATERHGAKLVGYYAPTKFAGATNIAYALIDFPDLTVYESYREALTRDPEVLKITAEAEASGCILIEERSFLRRVS